MDIIGIDPGSLRTGWGIIREQSGVLCLVDCGIIRTENQGSSGNFSERLALIYTSLCSILGKYTPDECAVEQIFTALNASSALKLGQARGAAIAACASFSLPVYDYEPTVVKKSLVGVGRAEKQQVAFMVCQLLNIENKKRTPDVTDALAIAICHMNQKRYQKFICAS